MPIITSGRASPSREHNAEAIAAYARARAQGDHGNDSDGSSSIGSQTPMPEGAPAFNEQAAQAFRQAHHRRAQAQYEHKNATATGAPSGSQHASGSGPEHPSPAPTSGHEAVPTQPKAHGSKSASSHLSK
jgi:hypothetical protein